MKVEALLPNISPMPIGSNGNIKTDVPAVSSVQNGELLQSDINYKNEDERLQKAVDQANKALEGTDRRFKYEMHKETKQVVVSVIDNRTQEVIGELPPKKLLDAIAKLMDLAGLFVDKKA